MSGNGDFRSKAAECLFRAKNASNEEDKRTWLMLGESWLILENFQLTAERELQAAQRETGDPLSIERTAAQRL
jgi:hypothetical protein